MEEKCQKSDLKMIINCNNELKKSIDDLQCACSCHQQETFYKKYISNQKEMYYGQKYQVFPINIELKLDNKNKPECSSKQTEKQKQRKKEYKSVENELCDHKVHSKISSRSPPVILMNRELKLCETNNVASLYKKPKVLNFDVSKLSLPKELGDIHENVSLIRSSMHKDKGKKSHKIKPISARCTVKKAYKFQESFLTYVEVESVNDKLIDNSKNKRLDYIAGSFLDIKSESTKDDKSISSRKISSNTSKETSLSNYMISSAETPTSSSESDSQRSNKLTNDDFINQIEKVTDNIIVKGYVKSIVQEPSNNPSHSIENSHIIRDNFSQYDNRTNTVSVNTSIVNMTGQIDMVEKQISAHLLKEKSKITVKVNQELDTIANLLFPNLTTKESSRNVFDVLQKELVDKIAENKDNTKNILEKLEIKTKFSDKNINTSKTCIFNEVTDKCTITDLTIAASSAEVLTKIHEPLIETLNRSSFNDTSKDTLNKFAKQEQYMRNLAPFTQICSIIENIPQNLGDGNCTQRRNDNVNKYVYVHKPRLCDHKQETDETKQSCSKSKQESVDIRQIKSKQSFDVYTQSLTESKPNLDKTRPNLRESVLAPKRNYNESQNCSRQLNSNFELRNRYSGLRSNCYNSSRNFETSYNQYLDASIQSSQQLQNDETNKKLATQTISTCSQTPHLTTSSSNRQLERFPKFIGCSIYDPVKYLDNLHLPRISTNYDVHPLKTVRKRSVNSERINLLQRQATGIRKTNGTEKNETLEKPEKQYDDKTAKSNEKLVNKPKESMPLNSTFKQDVLVEEIKKKAQPRDGNHYKLSANYNTDKQEKFHKTFTIDNDNPLVKKDTIPQESVSEFDEMHTQNAPFQVFHVKPEYINVEMLKVNEKVVELIEEETMTDLIKQTESFSEKEMLTEKIGLCSSFTQTNDNVQKINKFVKTPPLFVNIDQTSTTTLDVHSRRQFTDSRSSKDCASNNDLDGTQKKNKFRSKSPAQRYPSWKTAHLNTTKCGHDASRRRYSNTHSYGYKRIHLKNIEAGTHENSTMPDESQCKKEKRSYTVDSRPRKQGNLHTEIVAELKVPKNDIIIGNIKKLEIELLQKDKTDEPKRSKSYKLDERHKSSKIPVLNHADRYNKKESRESNQSLNVSDLTTNKITYNPAKESIVIHLEHKTIDLNNVITDKPDENVKRCNSSFELSRKSNSLNLINLGNDGKKLYEDKDLKIGSSISDGIVIKELFKNQFIRNKFYKRLTKIGCLDSIDECEEIIITENNELVKLENFDHLSKNDLIGKSLVINYSGFDMETTRIKDGSSQITMARNARRNPEDFASTSKYVFLLYITYIDHAYAIY